MRWHVPTAKFKVQWKGDGVEQFGELIDAAFLVAWNDVTRHISWQDELTIEIPVARTADAAVPVTVLHGKHLIWRKPLVDAIVTHFGPVFAIELNDAGEPLPTQKGTALIDFFKPSEPTGHERMDAADTIRVALLDAGLPIERIEPLIVNLDFSER